MDGIKNNNMPTITSLSDYHDKIKILPKSRAEIFIGLVKYDREMFSSVATTISICPKCNYPNIWGTTGLLPDNIKCENCKQLFLIGENLINI
jgi:hypothetical protein